MTTGPTGVLPATDVDYSIDELLRLSRENLARSMALLNNGTADADVAGVPADGSGTMREVADELNDCVSEINEVLRIAEKDIPAVTVNLRMELCATRNRLENLAEGIRA